MTRFNSKRFETEHRADKTDKNLDSLPFVSFVGSPFSHKEEKQPLLNNRSRIETVSFRGPKFIEAIQKELKGRNLLSTGQGRSK